MEGLNDIMSGLCFKILQQREGGIDEPSMTSSIIVEPGWLVYGSSWQFSIFRVSHFSN